MSGFGLGGAEPSVCRNHGAFSKKQSSDMVTTLGRFGFWTEFSLFKGQELTLLNSLGWRLRRLWIFFGIKLYNAKLSVCLQTRSFHFLQFRYAMLPQLAF